MTEYTFTVTAHAKARGWNAAFKAGVVRVKDGQFGRGERSRTANGQLNVPEYRLHCEITGREPWLEPAG